MKSFFKWLRRKIFGPTIQESITELVADIHEEAYKGYPNIQGARLPVEPLEDLISKYKENL